jgi:putative nucleotidyltransferase with HDIG domain
MVKSHKLKQNNPMTKSPSQIILEYIRMEVFDTPYEENVFLAGGALRDMEMGKSPKDLDFVVLGDLQAGCNFAVWLAKRIGIYREGSNPVTYPRYGTAQVSLIGNKIGLPILDLEFVATRIEKYTKGSRKPEVMAGSLKDDVFRRDFTINSLLMNVSTGEILDLTGRGREDIIQGVICTTGDENVIFQDDPLRLMRAIRFSCTLQFIIPEDLFMTIAQNSHKLKSISTERINAEFSKILLSEKPSIGLKLLSITGLLMQFLPEVNFCLAVTQNKYHTTDVYEHLMDVMDATPPKLETRLMALLHDVAKPKTRTEDENGNVHFYEHERVGADMAKGILERLKFPAKTIDSVVKGVALHMQLKHGNDDTNGLSDKSLRKFIFRCGDDLEDILDLIHADNISHSEAGRMPNQIAMVRERIAGLKVAKTQKPKLPINGDDLKELGHKEGYMIGKMLAVVEDAWYENPNLTKEEALSLVVNFSLA